jgi:hypothetical protein
LEGFGDKFTGSVNAGRVKTSNARHANSEGFFMQPLLLVVRSEIFSGGEGHNLTARTCATTALFSSSFQSGTYNSFYYGDLVEIKV